MSTLSMTAYGTLRDGTTWKDVPVGVASRIQWERTAVVNKWATDTHTLTFAAFLSWHASKRAGIHDLTWDDFVEAADEANVDTSDSDDPEGPTTPSESPFTA